MMNDYILYYGKGIEHYKRDRFGIHIFIKDKIKRKKIVYTQFITWFMNVGLFYYM